MLIDRYNLSKNKDHYYRALKDITRLAWSYPESSPIQGIAAYYGKTYVEQQQLKLAVLKSQLMPFKPGLIGGIELIRLDSNI